MKSYILDIKPESNLDNLKNKLVELGFKHEKERIFGENLVYLYISGNNIELLKNFEEIIKIHDDSQMSAF